MFTGSSEQRAALPDNQFRRRSWRRTCDRAGVRREECGMRMRLALVLSIAILISSYATRAFAHGEAADEPFLKDLTVAFYDVHVTPTAVKVGEPVTIVGTVKILETWPYTLDPPQTAYITPVVPGPCFALTERIVNDESAPGSIFVDKG